MPTSNQKTNDFNFSITIRIEGKNCHAVLLRVLSLVVTIAACIIKYRSLKT